MVHKHAYLILAHNQFEQLAFLVSLLDHQNNDIFIHVDKKSNFNDSQKNLVLIYQKFILQKELQLVGVDIHKLKLKCFYLKQRLGEILIIFII